MRDNLIAVDAGDADALVAMYAEDARFWDTPPKGEPLYGERGDRRLGSP